MAPDTVLSRTSQRGVGGVLSAVVMVDTLVTMYRNIPEFPV